MTVAPLSTDDLLAVLARGDLQLGGRLVDASNTTLVGEASLDGVAVTCVYKPTRGERPLWDFPQDTLGRREVATYVVDRALGWDLVPPTAWREDGPLGAGMAQAWVEPGDGEAGGPGAGLVDVVDPHAVREGWKVILEARGHDGAPVLLVHADEPALARMSLLDAVTNNADRKGGHVLLGRTARDAQDRVYGVDHGVTFHDEPKLRTVLWGWAGDPLAPDDVDALVRLDGAFGSGLAESLTDLLDPAEVRRTRHRLRSLLRGATYPQPGPGWPSLPWPAF